MKKLMGIFVLVLVLAGSSALAAESELSAGTEAETEETEETEEETEAERDYNPSSGSGWMTVLVNEESENFEYTGSMKSMTGTVYTFESDDFSVSLMLNKDLKTGKEMDGNAITQIEVVSAAPASAGYYFVKKSSGTVVESSVLLCESTEEGIIQGEFSVTVPSSERYVGDNRPGILEELAFTEGEFCFCE